MKLTKKVLSIYPFLFLKYNKKKEKQLKVKPNTFANTKAIKREVKSG
jgi:hypothetical protein